MDIKIVRFSGLVLGLTVAGAATVVLGCLVPHYFSDQYDSSGGMKATTSTGGTGEGASCSPASPCKDDENPCTVVACVKGFCNLTSLTMDVGPGSTECMTIACTDGAPTTTVHDGKACGMRLMCVVEVCTGCTYDLECGKTDECRTSTCQSGMLCKFDYKPIGTPVVGAKLPGDTSGDCRSSVCDGAGTISLLADDADAPNDGLECTDGYCADHKPAQKKSALGAPCANGKTFCNASQVCVECAIDANCAAGKTCYQEKGCVSCTDGVRNGGETDIDCGGTCKVCADKQACAQNKDCTSMRCDNGTCVSCFDGVQNGGETATDCGGASCAACPGTGCSVANQCALGFCIDSVCCDKSCTAPCKSCNLFGKAGICSDAPLGLADPVCPDATPVCNKIGVCVDDMMKKHLGDPCGGNSECFSNNCQGTPKTCK